jgi:hypothetical protein
MIDEKALGVIGGQINPRKPKPLEQLRRERIFKKRRLGLLKEPPQKSFWTLLKENFVFWWTGKQ